MTKTPKKFTTDDVLADLQMVEELFIERLNFIVERHPEIRRDIMSAKTKVHEATRMTWIALEEETRE